MSEPNNICALNVRLSQLPPLTILSKYLLLFLEALLLTKSAQATRFTANHCSCVKAIARDDAGRDRVFYSIFPPGARRYMFVKDLMCGHLYRAFLGIAW